MRVQILVRGSGELNAIDQASALLANALLHAGHDASVAVWKPGRLRADSEGADLLVLPYNPFMWGRWGFAPGLVRDVAAVRRRSRRPKLALVVHEPYVPIRDSKSLVLGSWQRAQLGALLLLADRRFASIEPWAASLSRLRPTAHLPSGSNVPDARTQRADTRAKHDLDHFFVVATLSTGHPAHLTTYVEAALTRVVEKGIPTVFLQLGAGAPGISVPANVRVVRPGFVPLDELGALVAAADLLLTPFDDGVSTRRGSFMAGLCQQVAVLATRGRLTDPMLVNRGLELVGVGRPDAFAERAVALARDEATRRQVARLGRELFDAEFTWDAIAARLTRRADRSGAGQ